MKDSRAIANVDGRDWQGVVKGHEGSKRKKRSRSAQSVTLGAKKRTSSWCKEFDGTRGKAGT